MSVIDFLPTSTLKGGGFRRIFQHIVRYVKEGTVNTKTCEYQARWRKTHADKTREYARRWTCKHRTEYLAKRRAIYAANPEPVRAARRVYRAKLRELRESRLRINKAHVGLTKGLYRWVTTSRGIKIPSWRAQFRLGNKIKQRSYSVRAYGEQGARLMAAMQRMLWLLQYRIWNPAWGDPLSMLFNSDTFNGNSDYIENDAGGYSVVDKSQGNWNGIQQGTRNYG